MPATEPNTASVVAQLEARAAKHGRVMSLRRSTSSEGRPLIAAVLSDPSVPAADKQHALIIAGRHGNEESGRGIALSLIDWLLDEGQTFLASHVIGVLPNANPDACEQDCYKHPCGVDVGADLDEAAPIAESRFLDALAVELEPDLLMDLHACGHVGCTHDMALYPEPRRYTEDDNLFHQVAADMCAAAETASGIPQLHHPMLWWDPVDRGVCARYYRRYKSLAILTETAEHNTIAHAWPLRIASGLAKVRHGLTLGTQRHPKLAQAGHANALVIGSYHLGVVAVGADAAARRASRIGIWRNADHFAKLGSEAMPEADLHKCIVIDYRGEVLTQGAGLQIQVRHRQGPQRVRVDGCDVTDRVQTWQHGPTAFIVVALRRLEPGVHRFEFDFGGPSDA